MREKFKKTVAYIFRSWEDEPGYTHPRLRILPPFAYELLGYLLGALILYQVIRYLLFL
jgi:hypothetical protein